MFGYKNQRSSLITSEDQLLKSFKLDFLYKNQLFEDILRVLIKVCKYRLTLKQKKILLHLYEFEYENCTFSKLALTLSKKLRMPLSTVKHILRTLRECELVSAGNRHNKGLPAKLSPIGKIIAQELRKEM